MVRSCVPVEGGEVSFAPTSPAGFVKVDARLRQRIDRTLGYFGESRFVFFYFEPRGEEVVWNDGHSYGFATGAWVTFDRKISPLARSCGVNLDAGGESGHVLLIDRMTGQAYFAPREQAERFVSEQGDSRRFTARAIQKAEEPVNLS